MSRLPDEYQEVEYIKKIPSKTFILGGFSEEQKAINRIQELINKCPSPQYTINRCINNPTFDFNIVIPEEAIKFLSENEKKILIPEPHIKQFSCYIPTVYRFIDKERYIDDFFEKGNLRITTFESCKNLESGVRHDANEGTGTAIGIEGNLKCEIGVGNENVFLLCTSLSENNVLPDNTHYTNAIVINNLLGFITEITKAIEEKGFHIHTILYGPCIYNNRLFTKEILNDSLSELMKDIDNNEHSFDFNKMFSLSSEICGDNIFFAKPIEKSIENEYRIVWIPEEKIEGPIIVNAPEAIQFCKKQTIR